MYIEKKDKQYKSDRDCALVQYYKERGGGGGGGELSEAVLEELISHYAAERKKRTELFVQSLISFKGSFNGHFKKKYKLFIIAKTNSIMFAALYNLLCC